MNVALLETVRTPIKKIIEAGKCIFLSHLPSFSLCSASFRACSRSVALRSSSRTQVNSTLQFCIVKFSSGVGVGRTGFIAVHCKRDLFNSCGIFISSRACKSQPRTTGRLCCTFRSIVHTHSLSDGAFEFVQVQPGPLLSTAGSSVRKPCSSPSGGLKNMQEGRRGT